MNIIFFGSSHFAVAPLKAVLGSYHKVSCVVTQPDKQKGRHLHLLPTPVKQAASEQGLKIYQPKNINTPEAAAFLKDLNPDLFIVIAYGQILSQEILDIPRIFSINVHASLLPKYRGAAPINWAIIKGEKSTGISMIRMSKKMDAGPIILQKKVDIGDEDTAVTLEEKLSLQAAQLLITSLTNIEEAKYCLLEQNEQEVIFAPKLQKQHGLINWDEQAFDIYNLIRGSLPWPGAFTYYKGKTLKIFAAEVSLLVNQKIIGSAGQIVQVSKAGITVAAASDYLIIKELQIEGRRIMPAQDFIAGHKIRVGEILGSSPAGKK